MLGRLGLVALVGGSIVIAAACKATADARSEFGAGGDDSDDSVSGPGPSAQSSSSGWIFDIDSMDGGSELPQDCSDAAKLIYVVGTTYELYSFDPPTKQFKEIGQISCPSSSTPFSMAVDRSGMAWVLYADGVMFNVSTEDASCTPTNFVPYQAGFSTFGMGFVSDSAGSKEETLYIGNFNGLNLGKIDISTLTVSPVGNYTGGQDGAAEITGTGDARLYGFFYNIADDSATVAEIDKSNANIISAVKPSGVSIGSGWAFAFWGGDFYLFTAPDFTSRVTQYKPSDGSATVIVQDVGFTIVGAGVSTCAPVDPQL